MSADLSQIPIRQLAGELVIRVSRILRRKFRLTDVGLPFAQSKLHGFDRTPFATLERPEFAPVMLWTGYRNAIKGHWRKFFWPVRVLLELNERIAMPAQLEQLAEEISEARTLPVPLGEILDQLEPIARQHPEHVQQSELYDPLIGTHVFALILTPDEVAHICKKYRMAAKAILSRLAPHGFGVVNSRVLEIGCGRGYMTYALGALGLREAIGLDIDLQTYYSVAERAQVCQCFFGQSGNPGNRVCLQEGDAQALEYPDSTFDLVHSSSVLEHITDPRAAFREMHRVLKPGGFAYHAVDPWFSPQGGHSMCILDFPWGHVRLSTQQFEDYVARYRPHEFKYALDFYHQGFQSPRLTISQMESLAVESGFEILSWHESRSTYEYHYSFLDPKVLAECKQHFPDATVRDLMNCSYSMLLRKRR